LALIAGWLLVGPSGSSGEDAGVDPSTLAEGARLDQLAAEHNRIDFGLLASFDDNGPVPDRVRVLTGRKVAIDGFMLPLEFSGGSVGRFVLNASYDMCSFGAPSLATERVDVEMTGGRRTLFTHRAVRVYGVLHVREERSGGRLVALYRLAADALGPPGLGY
jgi:hypothetical protein